jgi:hypothetical protein
MDIQESNVNSHNALELIQPIQMFVLQKEVVIYLTIVLVKLDTQEINVNSLNVIQRIQPI